MIHDNINIDHELMHYLHISKNGPNKGFVIKLDINKAYDRVEWNFLEEVIKKFGFEDAWVNKIMRCIWSVRCIVKCNMVLSETFSKMLLHGQSTNIIRGIRSSQNYLYINHLFFVDDALFFVRNKKSEVDAFLNIIREFA
ncbi:reverse transcriptase [Gossypium australe]|uniref:Reverse transcriptase n=1 Tax=Gossypium australe TaxID=47621 RepID=A0A5B6WP71_9ROSI|nr:reverse transcriptase [Gossypium australe]